MFAIAFSTALITVLGVGKKWWLNYSLLKENSGSAVAKGHLSFMTPHMTGTSSEYPMKSHKRLCNTKTEISRKQQQYNNNNNSSKSSFWDVA